LYGLSTSLITSNMSIWTDLSSFLSKLASETMTGVIEAVRTVFEGDSQTRRQVGFSVAMIALSAKMAKADGYVSPEEIAAFQEIFHVPDGELNNVNRLYNLARTDTAGFEAYAQKVRGLFPDDPAILEDVLNGLFHIAKADGVYHQGEAEFLDTVATIFGLSSGEWRRLKLRHLEPDDGDPYVLLEASPEWTDERLKSHYRDLVKKNHPDRQIARGVPEEFVDMANARLAEINRAWDVVSQERDL